MIVSVMPETIEGKASGIKTFTMICPFVDPIERAAWMTPKSTSVREVSIKRATKGAAAIERGMIVAFVPIAVPKINLESGKSKIIKIKNGKERRAFIIRLKI